MALKYGTLEGRPVVITDTVKMIGHWLVDGKWVKMHPADVTQVSLLTESEFRKAFPDLPALF